MNNLLSAALEYAKLGWAVFPCVPGGKQPATLHGVKDATTDEKQIKEWWNRLPEANVAIACGEPSGVHAVDIDRKSDINGWATVEKLTKEGKIFTKTLTQNTPSGGAHFFYKSDAKLKNKVGLFPGIDIRTTGGYVVVAPSVLGNGVEYKWPSGLSPWNREAAELPDFIRQEFEPKQAPHTPAPANHDLTERARAYLEQCDPAIQGRGGHSKLLWAAGTLVHGFCLPEDQAHDLLIRHYNPRCEPPWDLSSKKDAKDFRRKVSEAKKNPPRRQPGWLLDDERPSGISDKDVHTLIANSKKLPETGVPNVLHRDMLPSISSKEMQNELRFLTAPTGLVGDICSWITSTALKPQPFLSLSCSLAFCGTLFGRKVMDELDNRTNVYTMGVAESSSGKNHILKKIHQLAFEAQCSSLIAGDGFGSDAGLEMCLAEQPAALFLCDEIGHLLDSFKGRNASPHTRQVVALLMKLYSLASTTYKSKVYKDSARQVTLVEPCCCVYGTSVPERFFDAFSTDELRDGWLSRCLIFQSHNSPKNKNYEAAKTGRDIPERIVEAVSAWHLRYSHTETDGKTLTPLISQQGDSFVQAPPKKLLVPTDSVANEIFRSFDLESHDIGKKYPGIKHLWLKGEENARKIALIIAAGEDFDTARVTQSIADYSCRLIRYILTDFAPQTKYISDNEVSKNKSRILRYVDGGKLDGRVNWNIINAVRGISARERRALLSDLVEGGDLYAEQEGRTIRYWTAEYYALRARGQHV